MSGRRPARTRLADLLASGSDLERFAGLLREGGVAAIPTETFYALAADPTSERGVARILDIKGRADDKPLLVLFSERAHLDFLGIDAPAETLDLFFRLWPAPVTAIFPVRTPLPASPRHRTLAVRMPAAPAVRQLLSRAGPLTGTSANRSGEPPLADPDDVERVLGVGIDVLVDGGRTTGGKPSTIIDATGEVPLLIRAGAFPWPPEGSGR